MRLDPQTITKAASTAMDGAKSLPERRAMLAEIRRALSAWLKGWNTTLRAPQTFDAKGTAALVLKNAPPFECLGDALRKFVPALANADKLAAFLVSEGPARICKTLKARAGADKAKRSAYLCRPGIVKAILSQEIRTATGTRFYVRPDGTCKLLETASAKAKLAAVKPAKPKAKKKAAKPKAAKKATKPKVAKKASKPAAPKADAPKVDGAALAE